MTDRTAAAAAFAVLILLTGCAAPARVERMAAITPAAGPVAAPVALDRAIGKIWAEGGKPTVPFWQSEIDDGAFVAALRRSLDGAGMLAVRENRGRYVLYADLVRADQSVRGLDKMVRTAVRYRLAEAVTGRVVFDRRIDSRGRAGFADSPLVNIRERLANEAAIRRNFEALIRELRRLPPGISSKG